MRFFQTRMRVDQSLMFLSAWSNAHKLSLRVDELTVKGMREREL